MCGLNINLLSPAPDFIVLTETWLHPAISDYELGFINYNIYKTDRVYSNDVTRGGGVLTAISKKYCSFVCQFVVEPSSPSSADQLFVSVQVDSKKIILGAVYTPPNINTDSDYDFIVNTAVNLLSTLTDHKTIILGDFNLPHITWQFDSYLDFHSWVLGSFILA